MTTSTALEKIEEWLNTTAAGYPRHVRVIRLAVEAIQKAIDDDETGHWGPDITVKGELEQALFDIAQEIEGK